MANKVIKIGDYTITENSRPYMIAEIGINHNGDIDIAKKLIEKIEGYAASVGKKAVVAVCGPDGNPVAVHVMDGAFLVSFDVAVKKAYTAVSVKMSTMELGKLVQPGQTFAGLEQIEKDKLVFFGGGVPLFAGEKLVGGLGIVLVLIFIFAAGYRGDRVAAWLHPETAGDGGYLCKLPGSGRL